LFQTADLALEINKEKPKRSPRKHISSQAAASPSPQKEFTHSPQAASPSPQKESPEKKRRPKTARTFDEKEEVNKYKVRLTGNGKWLHNG
jgi:hypothetical protein